MRIDIPEHAIELMAQELGFRQHLRNEAHRKALAGDHTQWREMAKHEAWIDGVMFATMYFGVRQTRRFRGLVREAREKAKTSSPPP